MEYACIVSYCIILVKLCIIDRHRYQHTLNACLPSAV